MPRVTPSLTARAFLPVISGLRVLGHDPGPLLTASGVDTVLLDDPDALVPMTAGIDLFARAEEATGDACIGLHVAEHADLRSIDVHFYAMLASATLRDAYQRLSRYQRLITDTSRVELIARPGGGLLRHALPGGLAVPRQSAEFIVAAWLRTGRFAAGRDWDPDEVRFAHHAPPDIREHARFFRGPVRFAAGENALVIPNSALDLPCHGADPVLASLVDRHAEDRIRSHPASASLSDRVRAVLEELFGDGEPSAAGVAARLKMSLRTLNRSLADEGTTYRALLDQLRHELAAHHLANPRTSTAEVAFRLGFSDLSAFHRAFKRWTGRTPADFRKRT
jgi:AraC-like DNA-binding protein